MWVRPLCPGCDCAEQVRVARSRGNVWRVPVAAFVGFLLADLVAIEWACRKCGVRFMRRSSSRRTPRGVCLGCGYDLTGNVSGRCPECGLAVGDGHERRENVDERF